MSELLEPAPPPMLARLLVYVAVPVALTVGSRSARWTRYCARACWTLAAAMRKSRLLAMPVSMTRSEEHTSELQSLMRISYAVFCLKKQKYNMNSNKANKYTTIDSNKITPNKTHINKQ